jgi:hypothetical protein
MELGSRQEADPESLISHAKEFGLTPEDLRDLKRNLSKFMF